MIQGAHCIRIGGRRRLGQCCQQVQWRRRQQSQREQLAPAQGIHVHRFITLLLISENLRWRVCYAITTGWTGQNSRRIVTRRLDANPFGTPLPLTRRQLIASAAAIGASYAWGGSRALRSTAAWTEVRTRFPEGVASGDPQADSVILWTRCPATTDRPKPEVMVEVAEDRAFKRLVTRAGTK